MKKLLPLGLLFVLAISGCMSGDDSFLLKKINDEGKSQVLTTAGIDEYQLYIVRKRDFAQIPRIKEYFTTALRFDPTNARAQQYLEIIDNYKAQQVKSSLAAATRLLSKPKRTDEELRQAIVYLRIAEDFEPGNPTVRKMLADTAADWGKLRDSYAAKAKASIDALDDKTPAATREKAYTDAFVSATRALDLDPGNTAVQGQMRAIKVELTKLVAARVATIRNLIAAAKFADARIQVSGLGDTSRRAGNAFDGDVRSLSYSLNYAWAKTLYGQKDYATSEARVDAALLVSRTAEATALKKKLADLRVKAGAEASFDAAIQDIDGLIASGDLLGAHRRLDAMATVTTEQAKLTQLDDRDQKILDGLKPLYDQGVQAYRDEDFKTAIDLLQTVVGIRVDYEQAADYLDKAKSKQKLLDTF